MRAHLLGLAVILGLLSCAGDDGGSTTTADDDATSGDGDASGDGDSGGDGDGDSGGDGDGDGDGDAVCGNNEVEAGEFCDVGVLDACHTCDVSGTGPDGSYSLIGEYAGHSSGYSISSAGDVDGDGLDDILVGSPGQGWTHLVLASTVLAQSPGSEIVVSQGYRLRADGFQPEGGFSVDSAGDVDGDGLDDLLIGDPEDDNGPDGTSLTQNEGKVYLLLGSTITAQEPGTEFDLENSDYGFVGELEDENSGYSVASAGDVDADGRPDILIGALQHEVGGTPVGKTYLMLGNDIVAKPAGSIFNLGTEASYSFLGGAEDLRSGRAVASAGDVDADGKADILISTGRFISEASNSVVYLMLGSDITAQAPQSAGSAFNLTDASLSFIGDGIGGLSACLASAGDVDGDGRSDLIVGSNTLEPEGRAYLVMGSDVAALVPGSSVNLEDVSYVFESEAPGDRLGWAAASAGDVDGDGLADLLLGAPSANITETNGVGKVYLLLGASIIAQAPGTAPATLDLGQASAVFWGQKVTDHIGESVASAGDVNGDGRADLLVGAPSFDNPDFQDTAIGKTYLIFSPY